MTERLREGYQLTTDPGRVDVDRVHAWLADESYWATGRERAVVERTIAGSRSYSVFAEDGQAAYARVVTDDATFAWVCDVFVDEHHRGHGVGTWLVDSIVEDLTAAGVQHIVLATRDAHEVYRRCGFTPMEGSGRWMAIDRRPNRPAVPVVGGVVSDTFFAIDYSPGLLTVFRLLGMGPARSGVWVGQDSVRVRMGWGFRASFPRRSVREVLPDTAAVTGWGVHGWRGRWLVNGSASGLVRLEIEPGVQAWVTGVPVRLRTLRLSLAAPDALTRLLSNAR